MMLGAGPSGKSGSEGGENPSLPYDVWGFLDKSTGEQVWMNISVPT